MREFHVSVLAADNVFYEGPCESLVLPTVDGLYGILAGHSSMISAIVPGKRTLRTPEGVEHIAAVSSGIVKVENHNVLVLVDTAERPEDIDINRARHAAEEAKEALLQKRSMREYRAAQATLSRALNRLKVKNSQ